MPSMSAAQHRAMQAAAHGRSTIGIPKGVGQEFVQADAGGKAKAMAAAMRKRKAAPPVEGA